MSRRVIYTLRTTYPNHSLIVQKEILNVLYSAPTFLKKTIVICSRQTSNQLNNNIRNLKIVKKMGKNKHTCPMFDNDFLASSK